MEEMSQFERDVQVEREVISQMLDSDLIQPCSCVTCRDGTGCVFNLKDTDFYLFVLNVDDIDWMDIDCRCSQPCICMHGSSASFEDVLEQVPHEVQTKLLYHIDIFS